MTIDRPVQLLGPNAGLGTSAARGPEAVIVPPVDNPEGGVAVLVKARDVVVAGLTIDGHSDALDGGVAFNSVALNAASGISNVDSFGNLSAISGLVVEGNVIRNFTHFGVVIDGGEPDSPSSVSSGNAIRGNTIDNIPLIAAAPIGTNQGRGISIEHNFRAEVSGNVITRAATGIQAIFTILPESSGAISNIHDNVVHAYDRGILVYTQDAGMPSFAVVGNTVAAEAGATATSIGIDVVHVLDVTTGTIDNNDIAGFQTGLRLDYNSTAAGLTVTGGTISGNGYGVVLTNADPIVSSFAPKPLLVRLVGVTVRDSTIAGLLVDDALAQAVAPVTLSVDAATTATGNPHGVVLRGPGARLVDAGAPTLAFTSTPPSVSRSGSATFAFKASDNVTSAGDLRLDYSLDGAAPLEATGTLGLGRLTNGAHSLVLRATDQAGNTTVARYDWTVDTALPTAPSTPALSAASDTGASATDGVTRVNRPTFTGKAEPGGLVTIYANAKALGTTTASATGAWAFTVASALPDGTYAVTARVADAAGNVSASSGSRKVVIDTAAPTAILSAISLPAGLFDLPRVPVILFGKASDNLSRVSAASYTVRDSNGKVVADGSVRVASDGSFWGVFLVDVPGGGQTKVQASYTITLTVEDLAGNVRPVSTVLVVR